ncbi:Alpha/beta hydrolase fold-3 [Heliocybe sulcata]|uniref:Alpha/beta hydrolase fold-3 n=1 Tax=Heliocybe sulcata TaxID=5364 RepID=A0A5C3NKY3_9AGAM|nr:Alpha/beta hydrolase fold-3 [Heliocybe sulcata]
MDAGKHKFGELQVQPIVVSGAKCVVVSVDYRLAPENPYPAAVEDVVDSLQWLYAKGSAELNVDVKRIAVGGSSSGGNLAAILALKAAEHNPPIPLVFQLLFVPVTDNVCNPNGQPHYSWHENRNTVWLSPERMIWFRNNYLPNLEDRAKWDASPLFAPDELVRQVPKALVVLTELDILRDEGAAYGEKLRRDGWYVPCSVRSRWILTEPLGASCW